MGSSARLIPKNFAMILVIYRQSIAINFHIIMTRKMEDRPMELRIGKMTNKELAEWFGIKPDTMTRHKKKKLEELQNYAFFEEIRGGVEITGIIKSEYNKKDSQIRQIYQQGFEEVRQPLDTVSNINNQIYEKYYDQLPTLSSAASGYHYAIEVRNERYGIPFKGKGKVGQCYYCWCKQGEGENHQPLYIPFTEEEEQVKAKLLTKFFGNQEEKTLLLQEMVLMGEIKKEDAWDIFTEYSNLNQAGFNAFLRELEAAIGSKVVKATKFEEILDFEEPAAIAGPTQP